MLGRLLVLLTLFFSPVALAGVNINSAGQAELETLPGIGPAKAAAILQYRADHGDFTSVEELDNVSGIGPATMASLSGLIEVGASVNPVMLEAMVPVASDRVDVNAATVVNLMDLPGIGAGKAAAIVAYREEHGPFDRCEDLDKVDGIGASTLRTLLPRCTAGNVDDLMLPEE